MVSRDDDAQDRDQSVRAGASPPVKRNSDSLRAREGVQAAPARSQSAPGKRTLTQRLASPVQRAVARAVTAPKANGHVDGPSALVGLDDPFALHLPPVQARSATLDAEAVHGHAARGVEGAGQALPYRDSIQASFGGHDLGEVRAHVGGAASDAASAIGAAAYATGSDIAFASEPDLHTAAHEAAHVVQQRAGVQLEGGVGSIGDTYERNADAVADRVVAGESAVDLLAAPSGSTAPVTGVQRQAAPVSSPDQVADSSSNGPVSSPDQVANSPADGPVSDPGQVADSPASPHGGVLADPERAASVGSRAPASVAAHASVPHRSYELVYKVAHGDRELTFKLKAKLGDSSAGKVKAKPGGHDAELKLLEPKVTGDLTKRAAEFSATLVQGEFSLTEWHGLKLNIKLSGPSATLGSGKITVAKVAVVGKGGGAEWAKSLFGDELAGAMSLQVEIEGSYKITGELLAKLLEADEIAKRMTRHLAQAEEAGQALAKAADQESRLLRKKAALEARKKAAKGASKSARKAVQRELREVEEQLARSRRTMAKHTGKLRRLQTLFERDAERLAQVDDAMKGRFGKKAIRAFGKKFTARATRLIAKLLPILNWASIGADTLEVIQLLLRLHAAGWKLRHGGGGDEAGEGGGTDAGAVAGVDDGEPIDAGVGDGDGDAAGADGGADDGGVADGGASDSGADDGGANNRRADGGADAAGADQGAGRGDDPVADEGGDTAAAKAALSDGVRNFVDAGAAEIGATFNADQLRALDRLIPPHLDFRNALALVEQVRGDVGDSRARTPYEVMARIDAVVNRRRRDHEAVTVSVDGKARPDLATAARDGDREDDGPVTTHGPVTRPEQVVGGDASDAAAPHTVGGAMGARGAKPRRGAAASQPRTGGAVAGTSRGQDRGGEKPDPKRIALTERDVVQRLRVVKGTLVADELRDWANGLTSPDGTTVRQAQAAIDDHVSGGWTLKLTIQLEDSESTSLVWDFFVEERGRTIEIVRYHDGGTLNLGSSERDER